MTYRGVVDLVRNADGRYRSTVRVENRSGDTTQVLLGIDELLFRSKEDVVDAIRRSPAQYPGEPEYRKAWRFMTKRAYHSSPFSTYGKQHDPLLYLNSMGYGFCDDAAAVLAQIWKWQGYQARVWGLSGHVVAEVAVDGRWLMFDADYGVAYFDAASRVASVEELAASPELIVEPLDPLWSTTFSGYAPIISEIYSSKEDNSPHYLPAEEEHPLVVALPARSALVFPIAYEESVFAYDGELVPLVGAGQLELPPYTEADIKLPFAVLDVEGHGEMTIDSVRYSIGSSSARRRIRGDETDWFGSPVTEMHLRAGAEPVRVIFSISPFATEAGQGAQLELRQRAQDPSTYVEVAVEGSENATAATSKVLIDAMEAELGSPVLLRGAIARL